ncbi:His/Gly/Thr/Pro-type tRNA ligase C-terminal domain-containing protein [Staphylococcus epidermidis]|uniref:His/Gly/Thr/Pro-type tRNA ligase C-terminal domain-containing protein n=1 Tax=Staphylococcus epidermidis TaxID=1282 RepID=UPI0037D9A807
MHFHPPLPPYKPPVLPLTKKLSTQPIKIFQQLTSTFPIHFDQSQSIGKPYPPQHQIRTPYSITFHFHSLHHNQLTLRHTHTIQQVPIPISQLQTFLAHKLKFYFTIYL